MLMALGIVRFNSPVDSKHMAVDMEISPPIQSWSLKTHPQGFDSTHSEKKSSPCISAHKMSKLRIPQNFLEVLWNPGRAPLPQNNSGQPGEARYVSEKIPGNS